jgi:cellulose synthase/poly-beta-1,6-N-acetylglucosamine synthase-like glycosyltransferase
MAKKLAVYIFLYILTVGIIVSVFFLAPNPNDDYPAIRFIIIVFATMLLLKYFIYMFTSPWHAVSEAVKRYRIRKSIWKKSYYPKVSVLVPAWNEEKGVVTTAEGLLKSTYKNMEIIIINNASTDNTEANVKNLIKRYEKLLQHGEPHINIFYLKEDRKGKGHALNTGVAFAKGEIIVSIDADCYIPENTIQNFVGHFRDPEVMAAVGNVKIGNTQTLLGIVQYLEFLFSFYFKRSDSLLGSIYIIGGAAGAFRREVFEELGGYSTDNITEDIELSVRIQKEGMKIAYAHDALVYTEGAADMPGLIKQRTRWKRGRFETFLEHRDMFFSIEKKHNKVLSWVILPLAIFGDIQLALELFFVIFLYIYSYLTSDYSSFISGIIVVSSMFAVQISFDSHKVSLGRLIFLAPIGWLLLYVSTIVEFASLAKTFLGFVRKEEVKWQNWNRKGVFLKPTSKETSSGELQS